MFVTQIHIEEPTVLKFLMSTHQRVTYELMHIADNRQIRLSAGCVDKE